MLVTPKNISFIAEVQKMGFLIKIDTNGSQPQILEQLIQKKLINYVALDFKAMPSSFEKITQTNFFVPFEKSLHLLLNNEIPFEVRTTVHSDLLKKENIVEMISFLQNSGYTGNYYIQNFLNGVQTLEKLGYSFKELENENLSTDKIKVHFRG